MSGQTIRHRSDIDGLRAVAILPIVLFHAGVEQLSGGFIGVDIFFVISGFLISGILLRELGAGTYSLLDFYRRRVVRILPALLGMLLLVLAASLVLLMPSEIEKLGTASAATAAFVANIYLWKDVNYFADAAEARPLLHTWSLGVEEQFYIFFPPFLFLLFRLLRGHLTLAIAAVTLASLAVSAWASFRSPAIGFYLLPGRVWELGLGTLVALGAFPAVTALWLRQGLALAGAALILAGLVLITETATFPFPWALLPCVGTALLLAYGESTPVGRALSLAPMRWIGLISYSLYLWHWPLITFYRLIYGYTLRPADTVLLVAGSVLLGALSYYLLEQPFLRRFRTRGRSGAIVVAGGLAIVATIAVSLFVSTRADALRQLPAEAQRIADFDRYSGTPAEIAQFREGTCFASSTHNSYDTATCLIPAAGRPNAILIGDSHAAQLAQPLADRFPGYHWLQGTASGCLPTIRTTGTARCVDVIRKSYAAIEAGGVDQVVIAGRWRPRVVDELVETVRWLRGRGVALTVIGPVVEYDGSFPLLLARATMAGSPEAVVRLRLMERVTMDDHLRSMMQQAGARYYSLQQAECPAGRCKLLADDGTPVHFDYGHLTRAGANDLLAGLTLPPAAGR